MIVTSQILRHKILAVFINVVSDGRRELETNFLAVWERVFNSVLVLKMVAFLKSDLGSLNSSTVFVKMVSREVTDAIKDAISQSMEEIITHAAKATKRALEEEVEKTIEMKSKLEEMPKFKRKFNEDQFKHSKEMEKIMNQISTNLEAKDIDQAQANVEEGKKLIIKRQKMIKIADREEDGWEVIKCYKSDALASDTEDEKRLNRSRKQAKYNKRESLKTRRLRYKRRYEGTRSNSRDYNNATYTSTYRSGKDTPVCYFCGREGHMQYSCPAKRNSNRDK